MKKKDIELFCGINDKNDIYVDNKNLVHLYSVFMFFFVIVVAIIDYYKTNKFTSLIAAIPFLILSLFFFVWLHKSRKTKSYKHYFLFQGFVTLSISFIWIFSSFINIFSNELGFSMFYIGGVICGVLFCLTFFFLRISKWHSYNKEKPKEYNKFVDARIIIILIMILLVCMAFIKNIEKIILYKMLSGALFVLFFVFLTIALNMFANFYIVKKYYSEGKEI